MFTTFRNLWRSLWTPPPIASTDAEMGEAEREIERIELDELPEAVRRARSCVGKGRYCLGAGGKLPEAEAPWSRCAKPTIHAHVGGADFSDCSGFAMWCHRLPRQDATGKWWNTDTMEAKARTQGIDWTEAQPGDLVVYGAGAKIGHVGVVATVDASGPRTVIHCSASGKIAVKEEGPALWKRKSALILRMR
jgi:hypothetical protein